jgi:hypothetical protein
MGRVYNALAKADRLTDRQRPIGRPDSDDAETRRRGDAAIGATTQPARRDSAPIRAFDVSDEHHTAQSEGAGGAVSSDFDYLFALSETTGARRAAEPALLSTEEAVAVSPRPRVTRAARGVQRLADCVNECNKVNFYQPPVLIVAFAVFDRA